MFITGPDVVQAVTGEKITQNGLGGADVHAETSGRRALRLRRRGRPASRRSATCCRCCRRTTGRTRRSRRADDPADRRCEALLDLVPADGNRPYDMRKVIEEIVDDGELPGGPRALGDQHHLRAGPPRRPGRRASSPTSPQSLAGVLDIEASREGGALRADVRRLQHPAGHPAGRARLPAGRRPGARRDHPARREAAVRVLQRHRAADLADPAQGVRRRLHRHGLPVHRRRPHLRLADQRDRGDGRRGRRQRHLPPRRSPTPTTPRPCAPAWSRSTRPS